MLRYFRITKSHAAPAGAFSQAHGLKLFRSQCTSKYQSTLSYIPSVHSNSDALEPPSKSVVLGERKPARLTALSQSASSIAKRGSGSDLFALDVPFKSLGVNREIDELLTLMNIGTPTRVQVAAIPAIAAGENILISACTGSGKTLAYLAPLVSNILEAYKNGVLTKNPKSTLRRGQPCTLVLTPNRELATQVGRIMDTFHEKLYSRQVKGDDGRRCRQRVDYAIVTGGNKPAAQKRALRNGADVVIATPERLLEHIAANHVDLTKVKCVVLDEADLLVGPDSIMKEQILELINSIKKRGRDPQFVLASATTSVESLAEFRKIVPELEVVSHPGVLPPQLKQNFVNITKDDPADVLLQVLNKFELSLAVEAAKAAGERERRQGRIHEGNSVTEQTRLAELPDVVNVDLSDDSTDSARLDVRAKHLTEKMAATSTTRSKYKAAPPPAFADVPEFSALPTRMDMPPVQDDEILTMDFDDKEPTKTLTLVESVDKAMNDPSSRFESVRVSKSEAVGDFRILSPSEAVVVAERMKSASELQDFKERVTVTAPTIIFANSVKSVKFVFHLLNQANVDAVYIHGKVEPDDRNLRLAQFARGLCKVLITTPLLGRGIDLPNVRHVINFDFPESVTSYIHQAGRTARAKAPGDVTTLVTRKDMEAARSLRMGDVANSPLTSCAGRVSSPTVGYAPWGNFGYSCNPLALEDYTAKLLTDNSNFKKLRAFQKDITAIPAASRPSPVQDEQVPRKAHRQRERSHGSLLPPTDQKKTTLFL